LTKIELKRSNGLSNWRRHAQTSFIPPEPSGDLRTANDVAYHSAKELLELIGDILDIARSESGHLSLNLERVNPEEFVALVARIFDGLARQKGLGLELQLELNPANPTIDMLLDPLRFKQVLSILVSNAIKFTEHSQVRIIVALHLTDEPNQVQMLLLVEDTGPGISHEDQRRLFEPFAQAGNAAQSARGGCRAWPGNQPQPVRDDERQPAAEQPALRRYPGEDFIAVTHTASPITGANS
jgi:signal transduction histidine kinase